MAVSCPPVSLCGVNDCVLSSCIVEWCEWLCPALTVCRLFAGEVKDLPAALHVPVLFPCMSSEVLHIAVNVQTGAFLASVPGSKSMSSCHNFTL